MSSLTKAELIDHSATFLAHRTHYISHKAPFPRETFKHFLFPVKKLSALQTNRHDDDKRIAQYVVTTQKTLLIAREGTPSSSTPSHQDMSHGHVLAAGHIFFNAANEVVGLSNESDDFEELSVHSMLWPVLILHLTGTTLATPFILIPSVIDNDGFNTSGEFELTRADRIMLTEKLSPRFCQAIQNANQAEAIIIREHLSKKHLVSTANTPHSSHREIFFPFKKQQTNSETRLAAIEYSGI